MITSLMEIPGPGTPEVRRWPQCRPARTGPSIVSEIFRNLARPGRLAGTYAV